MKKILVIGSANVDFSVQTSYFPEAGETMLGEALMIQMGGKGNNQAVAASRLGGEVSMIAAIGQDLWGEQLLANWQEEKVNTTGVIARPEATGTAHITVAGGDNAIIVIPGANHHLQMHQINEQMALIDEADIVVLQLEIPLETVMSLIELLDEKGKIIILDPAPAQALPLALIEKCTYLTPNEGELEKLFKGPAEEVLAKYPQQVLLTKGKDGAYYHDGDKVVHIPSPAVTVVDTTGAGDTFAGALAVALAEEQPLKAAVQFAVRSASLACRKLGAQAGMPKRDDLEEWCEQ